MAVKEKKELPPPAWLAKSPGLLPYPTCEREECSKVPLLTTLWTASSCFVLPKKLVFSF